MPQDPCAQREALNYENPIPSREYILSVLKEAGEPLSQDDLAEALDLHDDEQHEALRRRLRAMCRDAQLMVSRKGLYGLIDRLHLLAGHVEGRKDGNGLFFPEDGSEPLFVQAKSMRQVMHGDKVLVRVQRGIEIRGKRVASIVEVTERKEGLIAGRFFKEEALFVVEPDNQRINQSIIIPEDKRHGAKHGQMVSIKVVTPPNRHTPAIGEVVEVLGEYLAPGMETDVAIRSHDLPHLWSDACVRESEAIADTVQNSDLEGRVDLRDKAFVTIDGEDAKDFDDAIYCEKRRGGWTLWVAIADVSHYVKPGSALDEEAIKRGNSVYFPKRVIPMLPEKLSNGLCSLRPEVDRLVLVCEMTVSNKGKVSQSRFYSAVIHSHARLTYTAVADMTQYARDDVRKQYRHVVSHIDELYELYGVLHDYRMDHGSLYFEVPQPRFIFDKQLKLEKILPVHRNDAHCLVEECMLAANVSAAKFILEAEVDGVYRVHPGPKPDKIADLQSFLRVMGLHLGGELKPEPKDYAKLVSEVELRPDAAIIQMQLLRSLQQAYYSVDCALHFGLAFEHYTHFTSPIRRYPDLLVHRIIKAICEQQKAPHPLASLKRYAQHCSQTERRADEATRDVASWLKCEFMAGKVGETFEAIIASVTGFGFFVELCDTLIEGLVHVSSLDNDYYTFDEIRQCLYGERTRRQFHLGDSVRVRLVRVSLDDRQIDFELDAPPVETPKKKKRRRRR
ncbi:MAG: ribonuclease R [Gammaproteobacteria bacterium CG11_big_fil_rev_8_21_14_0_20_46_22]|nr:MAG: ribonuclease R [Gammaproteobacteria bacterium CG12_big_fil_rev_8_21_14_0_65_46_12]PIR12095.1 MAG: ribonuclease R [Gammaproteobacteria bacterium CG11_big_fil_rev_8_21_14_0_20_46_22]